MKKINVLFALAAVIMILGVFFACQVDTAERITVTFTDPNGGTPTRKVDIVKGSSLGGSMYSPSRPGPYKFYGWFEGQSQYFSSTPISVDITLVARWSDDIATVSFAFTQTSEGNVIEPTAQIPPITAIKSLPLGPLAFPVAPRSRGWQFDAWLLNGVEFTTETIIPGDITLTARWVAKEIYTVWFDPGPGGGDRFKFEVYANECIDEWEVRFPEPLTGNTLKPMAFFVDWFDGENLMYNGRTPIRKNHLYDLAANPTAPDYLDKHDPITGKWGLPAYTIDLRMVDYGGEIEELTTSETNDSYGNIDYMPVSRLSWDGKQVIVNNVTYDVPNNNNRWRILYRIKFKLPDDFNTGFYTRYTIRARFYANRQGAVTWENDPDRDPEKSAFVPNIPTTDTGYKEAGWLKKKDYAVVGDDGKWKEYSRSEDGWGQISFTSVPNFNGQGADAETMLQRYNLDRKGGTINDTWAPLRSKDLAYPPYLLIQTSDAYIGHIEITEIVFHNGEFEHANYEGEEEPEPDDGE